MGGAVPRHGQGDQLRRRGPVPVLPGRGARGDGKPLPLHRRREEDAQEEARQLPAGLPGNRERRRQAESALITPAPKNVVRVRSVGSVWVTSSSPDRRIRRLSASVRVQSSPSMYGETRYEG